MQNPIKLVLLENEKLIIYFLAIKIQYKQFKILSQSKNKLEFQRKYL